MNHSADSAPSQDNELRTEDMIILKESETEVLIHQIAGHSRTGVLKHRLGYVLKPVQKTPLGEREVNFYKKIHCDKKTESETTTKMFSTFIPGFHGVAVIEGSATPQKAYLMLDDVVQDFACPCIIDIKIGKQTWDPSASIEKIEHEKKKYAGTKATLGISITGMQFYNIDEQTTFKCEKEWGKTLTEKTMYTALHNFFNKRAIVKQYLAKVIVKKLSTLLELFQSQTEYLFYASSLLITYDGKYVNDNIYNEPSTSHVFQRDAGENHENWLRVRMIDFAHVIPAEGSVDSNYLHGLRNIIQVFNNIACSLEPADNDTLNT